MTKVSVDWLPIRTVPKLFVEPLAAASVSEAGVIPVPVSITEGDPPGDAEATRFAVRVPPAVGLNVTATMQLAPAASDSGQLDDTIMKSPALVPLVVTEMPVVVPAAPVPVFETVKVSAGLLPLTTVLWKVVRLEGLIERTPGQPVFAPGLQTPLWHMSPTVQALLSLHVEPSWALVGDEQTPVDGLQVPAT